MLSKIDNIVSQYWLDMMLLEEGFEISYEDPDMNGWTSDAYLYLARLAGVEEALKKVAEYMSIVLDDMLLDKRYFGDALVPKRALIGGYDLYTFLGRIISNGFVAGYFSDYDGYLVNGSMLIELTRTAEIPSSNDKLPFEYENYEHDFDTIKIIADAKAEYKTAHGSSVLYELNRFSYWFAKKYILTRTDIDLRNPVNQLYSLLITKIELKRGSIKIQPTAVRRYKHAWAHDNDRSFIDESIFDSRFARYLTDEEFLELLGHYPNYKGGKHVIVGGTVTRAEGNWLVELQVERVMPGQPFVKMAYDAHKFRDGLRGVYNG